MTTKVEPTVEKWEEILKKAEKYVRANSVYYGNDQYRLSMTDWLYFIKGVANEVEAHSLQEAKAEGYKQGGLDCVSMIAENGEMPWETRKARERLWILMWEDKLASLKQEEGE